MRGLFIDGANDGAGLPALCAGTLSTRDDYTALRLCNLLRIEPAGSRTYPIALFKNPAHGRVFK